MRRTTAAGLLAGAAAGWAAYRFLVRPWHQRWGATDEELSRPMPGDDLVRYPEYVTNRAITIRARPEQVWPWVAQMGEWPRGGFYSYAWFERLQGMDVADEENLLPEFQDPQPGEALDRGRNLIVKAVAPGEYLILGPPPEPGFECSWCLALFPAADGRTRLVSRVRARAHRTLRRAPLRAVIGPGQFVMERKMLLGIRRRAEARARAGELAAQVEQAAPRASGGARRTRAREEAAR